MVKKKSAFITHEEQDEIIEKLKRENPNPYISWDWVRDSIFWTGSGLDALTPEEIRDLIDKGEL